MVFDASTLMQALKSASVTASELGVVAMLDNLQEVGVIDESAVKEKKKPEALTKVVSDYYDARVDAQVKIGERMRFLLNQTLVEGWIEGENLSDLKDRVRKVFNGLASVSRARTIARTEIHVATNAGRFQTMRAQGVAEHEWLSAGDGEVRNAGTGSQYNHKIDGTRVTVGQSFPTGGGIRHPGDPFGPAGDVINCRCTVLPVVKSRTVLSE